MLALCDFAFGFLKVAINGQKVLRFFRSKMCEFKLCFGNLQLRRKTSNTSCKEMATFEHKWQITNNIEQKHKIKYVLCKSNSFLQIPMKGITITLNEERRQ